MAAIDDGPRNRWRPALAGTIALTLAAGCASTGTRSIPRRPTTSITVDAGVTVRRTDSRVANRTTVDAETTMLVPDGALGPGTTLEVRPSAPAPSMTIGSIEISTRRYDLATTGPLHRPVVLDTVVDDAGRLGPPTGVRLDPSTGVWQPISSAFTDGHLTMYLPSAGTYGWARWNWDTVSGIALDAMRRALDSGSATSCDAGASTDGLLGWCDDGAAHRVVNRATGPRTLIVGPGASSGAPAPSLLSRVADALRPTLGDGGVVLGPGTSTRVTADAAASVVLRTDGLSRSATTIAGTIGFAVGWRAGSIERARRVLAADDAYGAAAGAATTDGCTDAVARLLSPDDGDPSGDLVRLGRAVVAACATPTVEEALALVPDPHSALIAALGADGEGLPDALVEALARELARLVVAMPNSEVTLQTPAPPAPPVTVDAAATPPPSTSTATPAPAPIPNPAPTPAPPATTAPPPTAEPATAAPAPPPARPALAVAPGTCHVGDKGGKGDPKGKQVVAVRVSSLAPGAAVVVTLTSPSGAGTQHAATASETGAVQIALDCTGYEQGRWSVSVTTSTGAAAGPVSFQVKK